MYADKDHHTMRCVLSMVRVYVVFSTYAGANTHTQTVGKSSKGISSGSAATELQKILTINFVCNVVYYYYQYDRPSFAFVSIKRIMALTLFWKSTDSLIQTNSIGFLWTMRAQQQQTPPNRRPSGETQTQREKSRTIFRLFLLGYFGATSRAHII